MSFSVSQSALLYSHRFAMNVYCSDLSASVHSSKTLPCQCGQLGRKTYPSCHCFQINHPSCQHYQINHQDWIQHYHLQTPPPRTFVILICHIGDSIYSCCSVPNCESIISWIILSSWPLGACPVNVRNDFSCLRSGRMCSMKTFKASPLRPTSTFLRRLS